ncbi:hypothetical protein QTP88_020236 [Uroleucon formosanum]
MGVEINTNEQGEASLRTSSRVDSSGSASSAIKLAPLHIPVFNGKYVDWTPFYDMLMAFVHTNDKLTSIQTFFHLRSFLSNEPASCIKNLETTASNYEYAWKTLISRYRNEKLLIQSHVKGICELSDVKDNSSSSLRQFADALRGHMSTPEALKQQPGNWRPLLTHIICTKLDAITLSEWEMKSPKNEISKLEDLVLFLDSRSQVLEAIESSKNISKIADFGYKNKHENRKNKFGKNNKIFTSLVSTSEIKCYACDLSHTIYKCPSFLSLTVAERIKKANALGLCKVCLRKHEFKRCLSQNNCYKCHKSHNMLLHLMNPQKFNEKNSSEVSNQQAANTSTSAHTSSIDHENILLSTAVVRAIRKCTISVLCRFLLDLGSQSSVTQHARFESRVNNYNFLLKMLVVPKITGDLPAKNITDLCGTPENIKLADPLYRVPQKIDILIGATHFYDLLCERQIKLHRNGPVFQETKLGWVVSGPVSSLERKTEMKISTVHHVTSTHTESILENTLPSFWRMEEFIINAPLIAEEKILLKITIIKIAGSIESMAAIYPKKFKYVPPTPPTDLIDCSNFILEFTGRKFLNVGLDPTDELNTVVQIITPSRYINMPADFLRRIFSLMGNILSFILDQPQKYKRNLFLETEIISLSSMVYQGENMLVIESKIQAGCRVLLNRSDLLRLQYLAWSIHETIVRKSTIIRPLVLKQFEIMANYLDQEFTKVDSPPKTPEEMIVFIKNLSDDKIIESNPKEDMNFISQLKMFATTQLAE